MDTMIAFCGINCTNCQAYVATQEDNEEKRVDTAKAWSTLEYPLKPEDVNCDGCPTKNGRTPPFVGACTIRACGQKRNVPNCAYCSKYACKPLQKSHQKSPVAEQTLETIHKQLNKK